MEKFLEAPKRLVPRLIQPRRPEYNVAVGRYIRQLETYIFKIISKIFYANEPVKLPVVMKGFDCFQQARYIVEIVNRVGGDWCAIGIDASRFDQHVGTALLRYEHSKYL